MNYHAVVFLLRPPDLLRCEPPLWGQKMPLQPRKIVSAQGGHRSKSLCDSKLTTHSQFTTASYFEYGRVLWETDHRERKISPKFFRSKFFCGRLCRMSVPKTCFFFQDLGGHFSPDVRRDIRPRTSSSSSSLGRFFVPEVITWTKKLVFSRIWRTIFHPMSAGISDRELPLWADFSSWSDGLENWKWATEKKAFFENCKLLGITMYHCTQRDYQINSKTISVWSFFH